MSFYPRRPVKSFQDLEVYQKLLAVCVTVIKRTSPAPLSDNCLREIVENLHRNLLDLPILIASAHSRRFGEQKEAIEKLDEAMLKCNLAVVYLELYRDLVYPVAERPATEVDRDLKAKSLPKPSAPLADGGVAEIENLFFEENIKTLLSVRMKLLHLQNSWKKFAKESGNT